MRARPSGQARLERQRRRSGAPAGQRLAFAIVARSPSLLVTLLLTAFGSSGKRTVRAAAPACRRSACSRRARRSPQVVALQGGLRIQLPVPQERLTRDRRHGTGRRRADARPARHEGEPGLDHARLSTGSSAEARAAAPATTGSAGRAPATARSTSAPPPGTDVFAPVDGTVVGLTPYVINGRKVGASGRHPAAGRPSLVVSVSQLRPDPALRVGIRSRPRRSRIGTVPTSRNVEQQALARFTTDAGNHVSIAVTRPRRCSIP